MDEPQMRKLQEDNDMAFFRADICLESPESFTLEEMTRICDEMNSTNEAIEDAMRADFDSLPPELRAAPCEGEQRGGLVRGRYSR